MNAARAPRAKLHASKHGALYCAADGARMLPAGQTAHGKPIVKCADCGMVAIEPAAHV
jgi:hypothetical protein